MQQTFNPFNPTPNHQFLYVTQFCKGLPLIDVITYGTQVFKQSFQNSIFVFGMNVWIYLMKSESFEYNNLKLKDKKISIILKI